MGPEFYKDAAPTALDTWFPILYCGGKRSATPLLYARKAFEIWGGLARSKAPSPLNYGRGISN